MTCGVLFAIVLEDTLAPSKVQDISGLVWCLPHPLLKRLAKRFMGSDVRSGDFGIG